MTILPGMALPDWAVSPEPAQPDEPESELLGAAAALAPSAPQDGEAPQSPTWSEIGIPGPSQPAESQPTWGLDAVSYGQPIPGDDVAGALAGYSVDSQYAMSPGYGPGAESAVAPYQGGPGYQSGPGFPVGADYPDGPEYEVSMAAPVWDVSVDSGGGSSLAYPTAAPYQLDDVPSDALESLDWGDWAMVAQPPQPLAPGSPDDGPAGDAQPPTSPRRIGSHARPADVEAFSEPPAPPQVPRTPPMAFPPATFTAPDAQPPESPPPVHVAPSAPEPSLADLTADQYLLVARYSHLMTGGPAVLEAPAGPPSMQVLTPTNDPGSTAPHALPQKLGRRAQRKARKAATVAATEAADGTPPATGPLAPTASGPPVPKGRSVSTRGAGRFAVAGVVVIGIGVAGFLAAQHFLGSDTVNEPPAGTPTTTLALPAEVAGMPRVAGAAAVAAVQTQLGFPLRNTPMLGTGAYGQTAAGPGTFTGMVARSAGAPPAQQFADYESRTGTKVGEPVIFGDITCAPVAKTKELAGGSFCVWSASQLRGQTFVLSAKPEKAAGITVELVSALTAATPAP